VGYLQDVENERQKRAYSLGWLNSPHFQVSVLSQAWKFQSVYIETVFCAGALFFVGYLYEGHKVKAK